MKFALLVVFMSLFLSSCGVAPKTAQATRYIIVPSNTALSYEQFHFAPAIRVGDTVWVSGQVGFDGQSWGKDTKEQTEIAFNWLKQVLEKSGVQLSDVVELTTYQTNMADIGDVAQVKDRYFIEHYPVWHAVGASELAFPDAKIEIKAIAVAGSGKKVQRVESLLPK